MNSHNRDSVTPTPGPWHLHPSNHGGALLLRGDPFKHPQSHLQIVPEADARLIAAAPELLDLVNAFVQQEVEYMTINNLGDPEKQHNVKWARAVLAKIAGQS